MVRTRQVIEQQPYQWEEDHAHVEFGADDKGFFDDVFAYKIETDPGKQGGNKIAKSIPADMYPVLFQWGRSLSGVRFIF